MSTDAHRMIRQPVVAGRFYEAEAGRCAADVAQLCRLPSRLTVPERLVGGLVPHAGWICSGRVAGEVWAALAERSGPATIFLTGSVHTMDLRRPALDEASAWASPVGAIDVDDRLRRAIAGLDEFETQHAAHVHEHALEVQLPMIRQVFGQSVKIVPCMIPTHPNAPRWGEALGRLLAEWDETVVVVASSDLTHYGPNYDFVPRGDGEAGCRWAYEVNDRRLLDLVTSMAGRRIVEQTQTHHNACGGGAIAAVVAAAQALGASRGCVVEHTSSA
ncbi:MAG: AmmeMemoRadiSam system protein B, partial [Deinococcus-Thermus bacterium]|nr:AmmeMemoRadiSam system protein B [Deinococcota bacterium]